MDRAHFASSLAAFAHAETERIIAKLVAEESRLGKTIETNQIYAWTQQVQILRDAIGPQPTDGVIYLEFSIPRLGKRVDAILLQRGIILVIEFKVGETQFTRTAIDQVYDYALDLKNFHETSHSKTIAPILVATRAKPRRFELKYTHHQDKVLKPINAAPCQLAEVFRSLADQIGATDISRDEWESGRYRPTPTIIEAAVALYAGHQVSEITRTDADGNSLTAASEQIENVIRDARDQRQKAICFVTGVPGAGKTLIGLNTATRHSNTNSELYSVFLSGNGPLVQVLREALARDHVRRSEERGKVLKLEGARRQAKAFIQNVHHFRDECVRDIKRPPIEHVAIFDEAQRAWDRAQTERFMKKRGHANWSVSEPEFLMSCLDRHDDWAVIVCLVGGGQEINTGESGVGEWINAVHRSFPKWKVFAAPELTNSEYNVGPGLEELIASSRVVLSPALHLRGSVRSFRANKLSILIGQVLDAQRETATHTFAEIRDRYPIVITRELAKAKAWLRDMARGSERFGIVTSSKALRLKPDAIDVRVRVDPVHWFLLGKDDVRSSYFLEDAATEYQAQGLELDWVCVSWDADLRFSGRGWQHWQFAGNRWKRITSTQRQRYLENAYRVLLTRARQGFVIYVPPGDDSDVTRKKEYYDPTYEFLLSIGLQTLS